MLFLVHILLKIKISKCNEFSVQIVAYLSSEMFEIYLWVFGCSLHYNNLKCSSLCASKEINSMEMVYGITFTT